jgi:hypothetical protein
MRGRQLNGENMFVQLNAYPRQVRHVVSYEGLTGLRGPWGKRGRSGEQSPRSVFEARQGKILC